NLDYLEELGINTIWITPIVDNIDDGMEMANGDKRYGYHGYWAKDFTKIDEHLGDVETLKNLVDSAHERGMKIMVDVVLNHAGYGMNDAEQFDGMIRDNPVAGDDIIGELSGLPDFRTEDPAVREQVIQWQIDWITELQEFTTDNDNTIDYFRVDTVKHVDNTTWNAFKNELTKIKPDFKMIGEWYGASVNNTGDQLRSGRMDSLLDFNFKGQAERFINGNIAEIEAELATRNGLIDNTAMMGQFLSSHDEDGFLVTRAAGNEGLFKVAAALQMTAKGQPVIYYGEELGQSGLMNDESVGRYYDENRYNLDWSIANDENDMLTHYKKLLNIRADYSDVFSKGTRQHVAGTNETGYSVFARTYGNEQIFVGLNTNEDAVESTFAVNSTSNARVSTFALGLAAGSEVIDVYNDVTYVVAADGTVTIDIPGNADGGTVILVAGDTVEEPVDPEEPVEPETPGDDRLDKIANRLEDLETAIDEITTNNLALVEELNVIRAEYERLRGLDAVTDAKIADLLARIAALEAIVADIGSESLGTGTDTPGVGGEEADGSDTDDSTEEDAATDSEEDNLPLTGETNSLMVSIIGLVFIGSGVALAFTFKKDERKE
ncbi:alpha-amylase family glycosyl hydrolase, partial [Jeotgalibaca porci]